MPQIDLRNWGKGRPDTPAAPTSTPSKEQFEAAAQKVMQSAPPGLSREDFFNLIDRELAPKVSPQFANVPVDEAGKPIEHEPGTWLGGFLKSVKDQVLHATVDNPALQGAANPKSLGDVMSLAVPSGLENLRIPLRNVTREIGAGIDAAPTLRKIPGSVISSVSDYLKEAPETTRTRLFNAQPLAKQMETMGEYRGAPATPTGRVGVPPQQTSSFSDLPLYKQQELMDKVGTPSSGPGGGGAPMGTRPPPSGGVPSPAPNTSDAMLDQLLSKFGGKGPEFKSGWPPEGGQGDWHSGADAGSADAAMAHALHPETRALDDAYSQKINDPLAALLMSLGIGAGAYGAQK